MGRETFARLGLGRLEQGLPACEQPLQLVARGAVCGEQVDVAPVLGEAALELDGDEAARVLGISPTAVSPRLSRALKKLEEKVSVHV